MECSSCGTRNPAGAALCVECGRLIDDWAHQLRKAANEARRLELERIAEERAARMDDLARSRVAANVAHLPVNLPDSALQLDALLEHLNIYAMRGTRRQRAVQRTERLRERMEEFEIDPDLTLDGMLEMLERFKVGVDLWTSPKRAPGQKYRCQLYVLHGWSLQRMMVSEAPTAWSAMAAAIVAAFEQGSMEWA